MTIPPRVRVAAWWCTVLGVLLAVSGVADIAGGSTFWGVLAIASGAAFGWRARKLLALDNRARRRTLALLWVWAVPYVLIYAALLAAIIWQNVSALTVITVVVLALVALLIVGGPIAVLQYDRTVKESFASGFVGAHPPAELVGRIRVSSPALEKASSGPLLSVGGLRTHFFTSDGIIKAVDGVNFTVHQGQTLGLVGESGCGKSITSLSIMRLLAKPGRTVAGQILFKGTNLLTLSDEAMEDVRGNDISMIFQEPMTALNPVQQVGDQITDSIRRHLGVSDRVARARVVELFEKVRIPAAKQRVQDYPHQLSGGMRQRVMIAMALACNPKLLIADEPTTALDVTIQAQILALLNDLKKTENMGIIMITHDLGVIAEMADHVSVMYAGKIVEEAPVIDLFTKPQHPYTQGLLASMPSPDKIGQRLNAIKGVVPHPLNLPPGCSFAPRCPHKFEMCDTAFPALDPTDPTHRVACYLYTEGQDERRAEAYPAIAPTHPAVEEAG